MPALADQAQILRCIQRDRDVIRNIEDEIKEILSDISSSKRASTLNYIRTLHPQIAQLCYYYYTSLSKYQTLGEEYVGIVLSRSNLLSPSRLHLLCMVMLRIFGPDIMPYALKLWEKSLKTERQSNNTEDKLKLAHKVFIIKETLAIVDSIRNGIFYLTGSFYDMAMWVTGVQYIFVRPWLRDEKVSHYFRILGVITLIHSIVSAIDKWQKIRVYEDEFKDGTVVAGSIDASMYCYLCMDKRKNTSATPCGHLFCWNCIVEAVRVKNVCPFCRERVVPSRIVILKNYDN